MSNEDENIVTLKETSTLNVDPPKVLHWEFKDEEDIRYATPIRLACWVEEADTMIRQLLSQNRELRERMRIGMAEELTKARQEVNDQIRFANQKDNEVNEVKQQLHEAYKILVDLHNAYFYPEVNKKKQAKVRVKKEANRWWPVYSLAKARQVVKSFLKKKGLI